MSRLYQILRKIGEHSVVETGSSGNWSWKKYADGTFDATMKSTEGSTGTLTQLGSSGIYYTQAALISFPADIGIQSITRCLPFVMPSENYLMSQFLNRLSNTGVYMGYIRYGSATAVTGITYGIVISGTYA